MPNCSTDLVSPKGDGDTSYRRASISDDGAVVEHGGVAEAARSHSALRVESKGSEVRLSELAVAVTVAINIKYSGVVPCTQRRRPC